MISLHRLTQLLDAAGPDGPAQSAAVTAELDHLLSPGVSGIAGYLRADDPAEAARNRFCNELRLVLPFCGDSEAVEPARTAVTNQAASDITVSCRVAGMGDVIRARVQTYLGRLEAVRGHRAGCDATQLRKALDALRQAASDLRDGLACKVDEEDDQYRISLP
jgi:hypothetical protein